MCHHPLDLSPGIGSRPKGQAHLELVHRRRDHVPASPWLTEVSDAGSRGGRKANHHKGSPRAAPSGGLEPPTPDLGNWCRHPLTSRRARRGRDSRTHNAVAKENQIALDLIIQAITPRLDRPTRVRSLRPTSTSTCPRNEPPVWATFGPHPGHKTRRNGAKRRKTPRGARGRWRAVSPGSSWRNLCDSWSRVPESNRRPAVYKTAALPTELTRRLPNSNDPAGEITWSQELREVAPGPRFGPA